MNHGTCPNGAFRSRDSCPWRKGQPQAPYQADFSVRIAHRNPKGTATNIISGRFLCSNGLSGKGSMVRLAELALTTETFSCIWYPDLRSQACVRKGCTVIIGVRLSGQERSTDCTLRRLRLRGKSVSSMREYLGALVGDK